MKEGLKNWKKLKKIIFVSKMKRKLIVVFAFCSSVVLGQEVTPAVINLSEAIKYALEHKAEAKKAKIEVEKATHKIAEVRSSALPQIAANAGLTYHPQLQTTYIDGSTFGGRGVMEMQMGQPWNANASLSVSQVIFNQGVFMGLKAARSTQEFYQLNAQLTENEIIEKVAKTYYQAHQGQVALKNIEENYALTLKNAEIVQQLHQIGLAKKIDVDRMSVALSNLASAKQQLLNATQLSENALKFIIGMPIEAPIALAEEKLVVDYEQVFAQEQPAQHLEIKVLEKQKTLLELAVKASSAGFYPSLSLVANYGYLAMGPKNPLFYGEKDQVYGSDFSSIGLNLRVPIFTGFGTKAKVKQAQADLQVVENTLQDVQLALNMAHANARNQLTNSFLSYQIQQENASLAAQVFQNTQNNYQQGLSSLTELLQAERSLLDAKNNLNNAIISYKIAKVELLKAQGKLQELAAMSN